MSVQKAVATAKRCNQLFDVFSSARSILECPLTGKKDRCNPSVAAAPELIPTANGLVCRDSELKVHIHRVIADCNFVWCRFARFAVMGFDRVGASRNIGNLERSILVRN